MTASPVQGSLRFAAQGFRDALMLPAWVVGLALVSVGSLARDVGFPVEVAVLSTVLVWAGPSQVIFFASIATGAAWSAIALSIGFASLRFLPMTVAILPLLRRPGQGVAMQMLLAHYVAVTAWAEGLRRLPPMPPERRVAYFLGFANACMLVSSLGTYAGYYLVGALPTPLAAGLLCLTPIFFLVSLSAGARNLGDGLAIGLGFVLSPVMGWLVGTSFDIIAGGLIGGSVAFATQRLRKRPS